MADDRLHLFGIRHHGPGSARSLRRALADLRPDCLLVEGPPDADSVLDLSASDDLRPPVAILVYDSSAPLRAAFYPFAEFSPEWQAIRYGVTNGVPTRFMDLPQAVQLAMEEPSDSTGDNVSTAEGPAPDPLQRDPLGRLAEAAGYSDGERWWDAVVESRRDEPSGVFAAIAEAMADLREGQDGESSPRDRKREAHMRQTIRGALKEGFERIAVVCGAWHVPALDASRWPTVKDDAGVLKGLARVKTESTWTPWTYNRLATDSGYGAGVVSPAWYELLWTSPDRDVAARWLTRAARLMRDHDLDVSSAHVIEAVRLSETLAALRGRSLAGLDELGEAALSVLCTGQEGPMRLVRRELVVGERLGVVPDNAPMAPLQRDLAALQKSLRLQPKAEVKTHDFDLRKPLDLDRSHLLHRLRLLGVPWGEPAEGASRGRGTFHEHWQLKWEPEFAVRLVAATRFGGTVVEAAESAVIESVGRADRLDELTTLLSDAILARLPKAVESLVAAVHDRASTGADIRQLMAAAPALGRVARYGDVRKTDAAMLTEVFRGVVERVCVGLPGACAQLDAEAASELVELVNDVHGVLATTSDGDVSDTWFKCLESVVDRHDVNPLVAGRASRLRHDAAKTEPGETDRRLILALSPGVDRGDAAAWLEGFLKGSGLVLLHDDALWRLVDDWVTRLDADSFTESLPLLRRTFSTFPVGERRQMSQRVQVGARPVSVVAEGDFDHARAARVLPVVAMLLGVETTE